MEPLGIETISLQPHPPFYATLEQMLAPLEAIVVASTQCLEKGQDASQRQIHECLPTDLD